MHAQKLKVHFITWYNYVANDIIIMTVQESTALQVNQPYKLLGYEH